MRRAAAFAAVVALAGCGGQTPVAVRAVLEVEQRFERGAVYVEGALSYVAVDGPTSEERRLEHGRAEIELAPGRYELRSWQRPCDGNCDSLDPPTDECSAKFEAHDGARLRASIVVRPGEGCSIDMK